MAAQTSGVVVQFGLDSSKPVPADTPFYFTAVGGEVDFADGSSTKFNGWVDLNIGTPQPGGASFSLSVADTANGVASVGNWILVFIPRSPLTDKSPFDPNKSSISGGGATVSNGVFLLGIDPSTKIKKRALKGSWDWCLLIQLMMSDKTMRTYVSDPEMDVDQLILSDADRLALLSALAKSNKKAAATANRRAKTSKKSRKR